MIDQVSSTRQILCRGSASVESCSAARANNHLACFLATTDTQELHDPILPLKLAHKAVASEPKSNVHLNTLGAAQYRGGKWQESIGSLSKAKVFASGQTLAYIGFFLAMAHRQLGTIKAMPASGNCGASSGWVRARSEESLA